MALLCYNRLNVICTILEYSIMLLFISFNLRKFYFYCFLMNISTNFGIFNFGTKCLRKIHVYDFTQDGSYQITTIIIF